MRREIGKAVETFPSTHDTWIRSSDDVKRVYVFMLLGDRDGAVVHRRLMAAES